MDPITLIIAFLLLVGLVVAIALNVRNRKQQANQIVLSDKYSTLAILSFVLSFFVSIAAVVLGHIALSQISRTHERGWGLAMAGLILGYLGLVAGAITFVIFLPRILG